MDVTLVKCTAMLQPEAAGTLVLLLQLGSVMFSAILVMHAGLLYLDTFCKKYLQDCEFI